MKHNIIYTGKGANPFLDPNLPAFYKQLSGNLMLLYCFREATGETIFDLKQNQNGTLNAASYSSIMEMWNNAGAGGIVGDAVTRYINIGQYLQNNVIEYNKQFSIILWIKPTDISVALHAMFGYTAAATYQGINSYIFQDGHLRLDMNRNWGALAYRQYNTPAGVVSDDNNYQIVFTYDGGDLTTSANIYVNADKKVITTAGNGCGNTIAANYNFYLLGYNNNLNLTDPNNFIYYSFLVFNKELSQTEIDNMYNYEHKFIK